ncbi:MAG: hypothetical protein J7K23_06265 [Thermoproteales archaeon]|nr:hypothetical protein [Thermoproteales archaeon]
MKYTTIGISIRDKERLERLTKLLKYRNLTDALRFALDVAEREIDKMSGDVESVFASLKCSKDIGGTNAEEIDKYLYSKE